MEDIFNTAVVALAGIGLLGLFQGVLRPHERTFLWICLATRVLAAVAMVELTRGLLGGGDMINYHRVGLALSDRMSQDFTTVVPTMLQVMMHEEVPLPVPAHGIGSATGAMNAFSGFVVFLGGTSIYGACAMIGFLALFTGLALYLSVRDELPASSSPRLLVACLLVPSVVFWSSALLKESVVLSGLFLMVTGGQLMARRHRYVSGAITLVLGTSVVAMLKAYILVPFGLAAGVWFYMIALRREGAPHIKALNFAVGSVLAIALIIGTGRMFPEYSLEGFQEEAAKHQEVGMRFTGDADYSLAEVAGLEDIEDRSVQAQAQMAPLALLTALFRPFIFEAANTQMFINTLETTIVLVLTIVAFYRCGPRGILIRLSQSPLLMFCTVFVLAMGLGIGLATTNLGTLSRYRMPFMPFLSLLLLELTAKSRTEARQAAADGRSLAAA